MPCYCKPCALDLDIETVLLEQYRAEEKARLDPTKAGIITIQYARLDSGSSEETVVRVFSISLRMRTSGTLSQLETTCYDTV